MVSFPQQGVTEKFLQQSEAWLHNQGLENLLGTSLDQVKMGSINALWRSVRSLTTPQERYAGFFDGESRKIFTRALDPATFFHELSHGEYFLKNLQAVNYEQRPEQKSIDEGLAFTLEVALFGCENVARYYLANNAYTTQQARYAHMMMENYMLGGNFAFERLLGLASELKEKVGTWPETQRGYVFDKRYLAELFNTDKTAELVRDRFSGSGTTKEQVVKYFTEAFKVPFAVAKYIFEKNEYQSLDQAIKDLGPIKTGTINAYKRIKSGLFFFADYTLEEAEEETVQLIKRDLHLATVKGLGEFEKAISLAYQVGGTDLTKFIARKAFTDPVCAHYLSEHLPSVFQALEDVTPSVKTRFIQRLADDEHFRGFLDGDGYAVISDYRKKEDPLRTGKYLDALLSFTFPRADRKTEETIGFERWWCGLSEVNDKLRRKYLPADEKQVVFSFLPELLAQSTLFTVLLPEDYKELAQKCGFPKDSEPSRTYITEGLNRDSSFNLMWYVLEQAKKSGEPDFATGFKAELSRLQQLTNEYVTQINQEGPDPAIGYYQRAKNGFNEALNFSFIGCTASEAKRNLETALACDSHRKYSSPAYALATTIIEKGRPDIAEHVLAVIVKSCPTALNAWGSLAYCVRATINQRYPDPERQEYAKFCEYKARGGE